MELEQAAFKKKEEVKARDFNEEMKQATSKEQVMAIAQDAKKYGQGHSVVETFTKKMKEFEVTENEPS